MGVELTLASHRFSWTCLSGHHSRLFAYRLHAAEGALSPGMTPLLSNQGTMLMSEDSVSHDSLAVRLTLIISRLLMGESLSISALEKEFNVSTRTLRRDFNQRLIYLDIEHRERITNLRNTLLGDPHNAAVNHLAI